MSFKEDVLSFSWLRHSKDNCPDRMFPLELYLFSEPLSLFGLSMRDDESLTSFPPYSIPDFMTLTISARAKVRASSNCKERGPDTPSSKSSKGSLVPSIFFLVSNTFSGFYPNIKIPRECPLIPLSPNEPKNEEKNHLSNPLLSSTQTDFPSPCTKLCCIEPEDTYFTPKFSKTMVQIFLI